MLARCSGALVPEVDPELLVALLEYSTWVAQRILGRVDQLPPAALTQPVQHSFPTLLATLRHVYGWETYYFVHLQGGRAERASISEPDTYAELRRAWAHLHSDIVTWATGSLSTRKDVVLDGWGIWPTWMVVMQMANHATHHFGQVVTLLHQLGYTPEKMGSTDLIRYLLRRYPQENQKQWLKEALERDATPLEASDAVGGTTPPNQGLHPAASDKISGRRGRSRPLARRATEGS
jgi:uncharacterized damage-inducible protein DinB